MIDRVKTLILPHVRAQTLFPQSLSEAPSHTQALLLKVGEGTLLSQWNMDSDTVCAHSMCNSKQAVGTELGPVSLLGWPPLPMIGLSSLPSSAAAAFGLNCWVAGWQEAAAHIPQAGVTHLSATP